MPLSTRNIQAVCDADMKVINVVAKWPGSAHDAFIWCNSSLQYLFQNGHVQWGRLLATLVLLMSIKQICCIPEQSRIMEIHSYQDDSYIIFIMILFDHDTSMLSLRWSTPTNALPLGQAISRIIPVSGVCVAYTTIYYCRSIDLSMSSWNSSSVPDEQLTMIGL